MTTAIPLSIIGLVLSFVMGVMGLFPGFGDSESTEGTTDTYSEEAVSEVGSRFFSMYSDVINDLVSYQNNPDYQQIEGEQEAITSYAETLIPMFQEFTGQMNEEMAQLQAEAAALAEQSPDETTP